MLKTKKLLSLLLVAAMALSMLVIANAAPAFPDVAEDHPYAEAIALLKKLTIVGGDDTGKFNPDNTITRAEFAKIVYVLYNGTPEAAKSASKFPDVAADAWFNGYVNWAAEKGIVGGRDTGMFDPNAPVTFAEASKMFIVAISGDNTLAWPQGFIDAAAAAGLYEGATYGEVNAPAARGLVAQLASNAIYSTSVLLAAKTPSEVYFAAMLSEFTDTMMLVSTYTSNTLNNDNSGEYNIVNIDSPEKIALAKLGYAGYTTTLKSTKQFVYIGDENIDDLVSKPVTVYFTDDTKTVVKKVEMLGTEVTYIANQLTSSDGKYYAAGTEIKIDWELFSFSEDNNSARNWYQLSAGGRASAWSGAKRLFDTNTDEIVTLIDTNGDGAYDWAKTELVFNAHLISAINEDGTLTFSQHSVGSNTWGNYNGVKYITEDTLAVGDYVNLRFKYVDPSNGTYKGIRYEYAPIYLMLYVSKCETVTGKLEAVVRTSATDISVRVDGKDYRFSGIISTSASADGADGVNSGRTLMVDSNVGKTFTFVFDTAGNIVRAIEK